MDEFAAITSASTKFHEVLQPLESLSAKEPIRKHCLIVTNSAYLIDVVEEKIFRNLKLPFNDINRVFVHCVYEPYRAYVICCTDGGSAVFIDFETFEETSQIRNIQAIDSQYDVEIGRPLLKVIHQSGEETLLSHEDMMCPMEGVEAESQEADHPSQQVAAAIHNKILEGAKHLDNLQREVLTKEAFIQQKLDSITAELQGVQLPPVDKDFLLNKSDKPLPIYEDPSTMDKMDDILKVEDVRHKIFHNKWVLCINISNNYKRMLVTDIDIILHTSESCTSYKTRILKASSSTNPNIRPSSCSIEPLNPVTLRPNKKCFIVAICEMPRFTKDLILKCDGMIMYKLKPLSLASNDTTPVDRIYQLQVPEVILSAEKLKESYINLDSASHKIGISSSSVILIGASICHRFELTSLFSQLDNVLSLISEKFKVSKVDNMSGLNCLMTDDNLHPLHLLSFVLTIKTTNSVSLTIYARDDEQILVFIHFLKKFFPKDCSIDYLNKNEEPSTSTNLLNKYYELLEYMSTSLQNMQVKNNHGTKIPKLDGKPDVKIAYPSDARTLGDKYKSIEMLPEDYIKWRNDIASIEKEIDLLYSKMHGY